MKDKIIDVPYRIVSGPREPIIKSWVNLAWFVGPTTLLFVLNLARVKGWL